MIRLTKENGIYLLALNRAEKRNALNPAIIKSIKEAILKIESDIEKTALIITGEGSAFCAGADLEYLDSLQKFSAIENERDSESIAELFKMIYDLNFPTIAAVNGPAIAGGCGLASVCDFIIADSDKARFGYSEVKIGFIPAIVSIFLIRKIGFGQAKKLLLTGEIITAKDATNIGLADYLSENVIEDSFVLAKKLLSNSSSSYSMTKKMIDNISGLNVDDAIDYCIRLNAISRSTEDFKTRLKEFLTK